MSNNKFKRAIMPVVQSQIPRPPKKCVGQFFTIRPTDTLQKIARKFGVTVEQILAANPQIVNPNIIFVGQVICIPTDKPEHQPTPVCDLRVLTLRFFTETGQPLPIVGGVVQLNARTIVRATFNRPVNRTFFFFEPSRNCEITRFIGIDCHGFVTGIAETIWQVPSGTQGVVYVVTCDNSCCAKSNEVPVVRNS